MKIYKKPTDTYPESPKLTTDEKNTNKDEVSEEDVKTLHSLLFKQTDHSPKKKAVNEQGRNFVFIKTDKLKGQKDGKLSVSSQEIALYNQKGTSREDSNIQEVSEETQKIEPNEPRQKESEIEIDTELQKMSQFNILLPQQSASPNMDSVDRIKISKATIPDEVYEIANQILVSNPEFSNKDEVRIVLKESFLPETEIRIRKESDGISVEFITKSEDSFRFLSPHTDSLRTVLEDRLGAQVNVQLQFSGSGEQQDGRSRQRRFVWEEKENID
ncbi:MAG: hypothetical protein JRI31_01675 [Deltaproteobacteria bacterium]|nr:hypothetical protein [Deltaproteobacteria bacterium]